MTALGKAKFDAFKEVKSASWSCEKSFGRTVRAKGQRKAFGPPRGGEDDIFEHGDLVRRGVSGVAILQ